VVKPGSGARFNFEKELRKRSQVLLVPIARGLGRMGLTPNVLTLVGLALNGAVAAVVVSGGLRWGGVLLLFASAFDALDGTLARLTGQQSRFGAFFDSSIDRYSESVVLGGLLYYLLQNGEQIGVLLAFAGIVGSLMVSYTRARAEGLDVECKVGLLTRLGRMLLLAVGLMVVRPVITLWILAILANFTAFQRMFHVWHQLQNAEEEPGV
jgi:CDP-diacylglycerol--glycerol-3-phosphate 3-phosphatidyltransferase